MQFKNTASLYGCLKILGPYLSKDGRKRCVLYYRKGKTPSRQYAKILVEEALGRLLTDCEQVDHINGDKADDRLENLQVLSVEAHRRKNGEENSERASVNSTKTEINCSYCGELFTIPNYRKAKTATPCCSKSCASSLIQARRKQ